jgi:hypothetical protein
LTARGNVGDHDACVDAIRFHYAVFTPRDEGYEGEEWHDLTTRDALGAGELLPLPDGPWVIDRLETDDAADIDAKVICRRPKWPLYLLALDRFDTILELPVERERPFTVDDTFIARGVPWRVVEVRAGEEPYGARVLCERDVGVAGRPSAGR